MTSVMSVADDGVSASLVSGRSPGAVTFRTQERVPSALFHRIFWAFYVSGREFLSGTLPTNLRIWSRRLARRATRHYIERIDRALIQYARFPERKQADRTCAPTPYDQRCHSVAIKSGPAVVRCQPYPLRMMKTVPLQGMGRPLAEDWQMPRAVLAHGCRCWRAQR